MNFCMIFFCFLSFISKCLIIFTFINELYSSSIVISSTISNISSFICSSCISFPDWIFCRIYILSWKSDHTLTTSLIVVFNSLFLFLIVASLFWLRLAFLYLISKFCFLIHFIWGLNFFLLFLCINFFFYIFSLVFFSICFNTSFLFFSLSCCISYFHQCDLQDYISLFFIYYFSFSLSV